MALLDFPETLARALGPLRPIARPLIAGLLVAAPLIGLFVLLRDVEGTRLYGLVGAHAGRMRSDLERELALRERVVRDLAARCEARGGAAAAAFSADADSLVRAGGQFRAFQWLDDSLGARITAPAAARLPGGVLDAAHEATRKGELSVIVAEAPTISRSYPLPASPRQFLVVAPLRQGGRTSGWVVGVLRVVDVLDAMLREPIQRGFAIQVVETASVAHVFGPAWLDAGGEGAWSSEQRVRAGDLDWTLTVWPSADWLKHERARELWALPALAVVMGLAAALVAWRVDAPRRRGAAGPVSTPRAAEEIDAPGPA